MAIEWPSDLWRPLVTDIDTDQYRCARDKAVEEVFKLRQGQPIVAVSGSGKSHQYSTQAKKLGKTLARLGVTMKKAVGWMASCLMLPTDLFIQAGFSPGSLAKIRKLQVKPLESFQKGKDLKPRSLRNVL